MSVLEKIREKVEQSNNILILTHENPDGDAIGSSLGLMLALKKINKKSTVLIPSISSMYSFLPGFEEIKNEIEQDRQQTKILDIQNLMDSMKWTIEQAMDALKIPSDQRSTYVGMVQGK